MKLQKVRAREYKGKTIYKWMIVIPPRDIKELRWTENNKLEGIVAQDTYLLRSKR
jgi:hypothetical protein